MSSDLTGDLSTNSEFRKQPIPIGMLLADPTDAQTHHELLQNLVELLSVYLGIAVISIGDIICHAFDKSRLDRLQIDLNQLVEDARRHSTSLSLIGNGHPYRIYVSFFAKTSDVGT